MGIKDAKGKAKEMVGKVTSNERLEAEGRTDQVKSKANEAAEQVGARLEGVRDSLRDHKQ
jgi:uncharacterized protein YjbJ (UPF0337 family)